MREKYSIDDCVIFEYLVAMVCLIYEAECDCSSEPGAAIEAAKLLRCQSAVRGLRAWRKAHIWSRELI